MNNNKPGNPISRRTGLDRRWIPSANHQPERRRSRDRRTIRKRSFLASIELTNAQENRALFPEINIQTGRAEETDAASPVEEEGMPAPRESVFKRVRSDDGWPATQTETSIPHSLTDNG